MHGPLNTNTHTHPQGFAAQLQAALQACGRPEGYDIILDALGGIYFKVWGMCVWYGHVVSWLLRFGWMVIYIYVCVTHIHIHPYRHRRASSSCPAAGGWSPSGPQVRHLFHNIHDHIHPLHVLS